MPVATPTPDTLHQPFAALSVSGRNSLACGERKLNLTLTLTGGPQVLSPSRAALSGADGPSVTVALSGAGREEGEDRFDSGVAIDFVLDLAPDQFSVALTSSGGDRSMPLEAYRFTQPNSVDKEQEATGWRYVVRLPTPSQAESVLLQRNSGAASPGQEAFLCWVEVRHRHHALLFRRAVTFTRSPRGQ